MGVGPQKATPPPPKRRLALCNIHSAPLPSLLFTPAARGGSRGKGRGCMAGASVAPGEEPGRLRGQRCSRRGATRTRGRSPGGERDTNFYRYRALQHAQLGHVHRCQRPQGCLATGIRTRPSPRAGRRGGPGPGPNFLIQKLKLNWPRARRTWWARPAPRQPLRRRPCRSLHSISNSINFKAQ